MPTLEKINLPQVPQVLPLTKELPQTLYCMSVSSVFLRAIWLSNTQQTRLLTLKYLTNPLLSRAAINREYTIYNVIKGWQKQLYIIVWELQESIPNNRNMVSLINKQLSKHSIFRLCIKKIIIMLA